MMSVAPLDRPAVPAEAAVALPAVAVVVVHWANIADTVACLRSLAAVDYSRLTTIVIDNGSGDFDEARLRAALPGVQVVAAGANLGFAGGNNLGIERALAQGADFVLLLNNDNVVRPDLIRALLPALDRPDVGIVGPVITYDAAPDRIWFAGGTYNRLLGYTFHPRMDRPLAEARRGGAARVDCDFITGCALLARREVFERVGLLREDLFLYFEDAEFCLRAGAAGYRCALVGEPLVRHKVSASAGQRGTNRFTPDRAYYFARNPLLLLRGAAARSRARAGLGVFGYLGVIVPINGLRCLATRDRRVVRAYLAGLRDGLLGRAGRRSA